MSNHIKDALARADIQYIREFIMYGAELAVENNEPYHVRLVKGSDPIYDRLKSLYPDEAERDKAHADLSHALSAYQDTYMEVGMKIGARLIYQLLILDEQ